MNDDPDVCFDAIAADVARRLADRWDVLSSGHIDAEIETTLLIEYVIGATIAMYPSLRPDPRRSHRYSLAFAALAHGWFGQPLPPWLASRTRDWSAGDAMRDLFDEYRVCDHGRERRPTADGATP